MKKAHKKPPPPPLKVCIIGLHVKGADHRLWCPDKPQLTKSLLSIAPILAWIWIFSSHCVPSKHRQCWPNIEPASGQCLMFYGLLDGQQLTDAGRSSSIKKNVRLMAGWHHRRWAVTQPTMPHPGCDSLRTHRCCGIRFNWGRREPPSDHYWPLRDVTYNDVTRDNEAHRLIFCFHSLFDQLGVSWVWP